MDLHPDAAALLASYPAPDMPWTQSLPEDLDTERLRDLYRGALLWGAVGDALGRPAEGRWPEDLHARYGRVCSSTRNGPVRCSGVAHPQTARRVLGRGLLPPA